MRLSVYRGSKACSSLAQPPDEKGLQRITEHERLDHQSVGHPQAGDQIGRGPAGDSEVSPAGSPRLFVVPVAAVPPVGRVVPQPATDPVEVREPDRVRPDLYDVVVTVDGNRELAQVLPPLCVVSNVSGRYLQRLAPAVVPLVATLVLAGCGGGGVDELVSASLGSPAKCKTLGLAEVAGAQAKVYSCAFRLDGGDAAACYTVIDGEAFRVTDEQYDGCGG